MNGQQLLTLTITLALLAGVAAGGWFAGAELLAVQPEEPAALALDPASDAGAEEGAAAGVAGRVRVGYDPADNVNTALVLGASELSPFGQPEGLRGRQVLAGRVVEVQEESREIPTPDGVVTVRGHRITLETSSGAASIWVRPDSTFLLRLGAGDPSGIAAGAAVALWLEDSSEGRATAAAALVLPPGVRPVLNPGGPPVGPATEEEAAEE